MQIKSQKLKILLKDLSKREVSRPFPQLIETGEEEIIKNRQFENDLVDRIIIDLDEIE